MARDAAGGVGGAEEGQRGSSALCLARRHCGCYYLPHKPMATQGRACPHCFKVIAPEETIVVRDGQVSHLDCLRPRVLSTEERAMLFSYCQHHPVAECRNCATTYRLADLVLDYIDFRGKRTNLCPSCQRDLTASIRAHLFGCAMLPAEVRRRAQEVREAARRLVKQSHQLIGTADVLMREAEAAIQALQRTMRKSPAKRGNGPATA